MTLQGATQDLARAQGLSTAVPTSPDGGSPSSGEGPMMVQLSEVLGKLFVRILAEGGGTGDCAYAIALYLAASVETASADAALALIEGPMAGHPVVTALWGSLQFQMGQPDHASLPPPWRKRASRGRGRFLRRHDISVLAGRSPVPFRR